MRCAPRRASPSIALHARTVQQHYSGEARWEAIAELKQAVGSIPVLGNGDIWEASDAVRMMAETGCDGVVIGRGCLGRPWLFGDLVEALAGRPVPPSRLLGEVCAVMVEHARLLVGAPRREPRDARLPQAHRLVHERLPRRPRGAAPVLDGQDADGTRGHRRRPRSDRSDRRRWRTHQARPHQRPDQGEPARRLARRPPPRRVAARL